MAEEKKNIQDLETGAEPVPAEAEKQTGAEKRAAKKAEKQAAAEAKKAAKLAAAEAKKAEKQAAAEAKKAEKLKAAEEKKADPDRKIFIRKLKIGIAVVLGIILLIAGAITAAAYYVTVSDMNLPNVYVDGVFVGGMTGDETVAALDEHEWDDTASQALKVKLPGDVVFKLDICDAGAMFTKDAAVKAAHRYGHNGNWFENLYTYVNNIFVPVDVSDSYLRLNEAYIQQKAEKGIAKFETMTVGNGYEIDREDNVLRLTKGAGEMRIDAELLSEEISNALVRGAKELHYNRIDNSLKMPDFQKLYDELAIEPQDAHFAEDSCDIIPEVIGCQFDVEEAGKLWQAAEPAEIVEIPLKITVPEVTAEYLQSVLFRDKLGSQSTQYHYSNSSRISNIKLCAEKINGTILMPGDVFSFNGTVGQRTSEAGFKAAGAYADGQVVEEIGGGICQVSSTLYCAMMYSQLETVERTNHYFAVNYLPISYDATVSWTEPDFKFRNNRDYPVKIVAYCDNPSKSVVIEIWGTDVDGSYVELTYWQGTIYHHEYTDVVIGTGAICYRNVYDVNGNYMYTIEEPYGAYYLHDEDIKWPARREPEEDSSSDDGFAVIVEATLDQ